MRTHAHCHAIVAMLTWPIAALMMGEKGVDNPDVVSDDAEAQLPFDVLFHNAYMKSVHVETEPGLTFNHLPKAGGSFIRHVVSSVVTKGDIRIENESQPLHPDDAARFTIGAIRNPCEYYVSLYSFGALGKGGFRKYVPAEMYERDSPEHFSAWLKYVLGHTGDTSLGVMSIRFAVSYAQANIHIKNGPTRFFLSSGDVHHVKDALEIFNASSVNCWVRTESVVDDMKHCLTKFELLGGGIDWAKFDDAIKNTNSNPSDHMACSKFFGNDEQALVKEADGKLFGMFGYSSCCEK